MDLGIEGRVALLTGASRGIGYACATALAAEGVRVAICARGRAAVEAAARDIAAETGGDVTAFVADVARSQDVVRLLSEVAEAMGGVDILLANNGGPPRGGFDALNDDHWQEGFDATDDLDVVGCRSRHVRPLVYDGWRGWLRTQPMSDTTVTGRPRPGSHQVTMSVEVGTSTGCPRVADMSGE